MVNLSQVALPAALINLSDAGSNIILRLSDLGYTVFALFPSQNESLLGQNESTRKTSKVASVRIEYFIAERS